MFFQPVWVFEAIITWVQSSEALAFESRLLFLAHLWHGSYRRGYLMLCMVYIYIWYWYDIDIVILIVYINVIVCTVWYIYLVRSLPSDRGDCLDQVDGNLFPRMIQPDTTNGHPLVDCITDLFMTWGSILGLLNMKGMGIGSGQTWFLRSICVGVNFRTQGIYRWTLVNSG